MFGALALVACGGSDDPPTRDAGMDGPIVEDGSPADAPLPPRVGRDGACLEGVGLAEPSPVCSVEAPCDRLLGTYALLDPPVEQITRPSTQPTCSTSARGLSFGRPMYADDEPGEWMDPDGVARYWCEARPAASGASPPYPLVIWVPGSGGYAGSVYDETSLRGKIDEPAGYPFVLISIQPRNLHWPIDDPQEGTKSETYHRDLGPASTNPDIAFMDHLIDSRLAEGDIDPARIYLMGWSNGARFAALYGLSRHEVATPGGNHVAAVANFSGGDPFATPWYEETGCAYRPYPTSSLPFLLISRTCDVVACNEATDLGVVPGNVASLWVAALQDEIGAEVSWLRIDASGVARNICAPAALCDRTQAFLNHISWPDGVRDGGQDHEPTMLRFLQDHPYPE